MKFLYVFFLSVLMSCQSPIKSLSRREIRPGVLTRGLVKKGRKIKEKAEKEPRIYVKKKKILIAKKEGERQNGSLYSSDNPENFLFYDKPKGSVGDVLNIVVVSSQQEQNGGQEVQEEDPTKLRDQLLESLPEFAPSDDSLVPVTKIKFKVDRKLKNGDLLVSTYRSSESEGQASSIRVEARIERNSLMNKKTITTEDLRDVEWSETVNDEIVERESLSWQDEYTLRLSGFNEVKSRMAKDLDNKKKDLMAVRDKLRDRINSLGKERRSVVRSREELSRKQKNLDKTLSKFEEELSDSRSTIEEQKEIIRKQQQLLEELQTSGESPIDGREVEGN